MANNNHPITPSPELVAQIRSDALHRSDGQLDYELRLIHAGYCAGADQELEVCCKWLRNCLSEELHEAAQELRTARRPKPPSLKEQALEQLKRVDSDLRQHGIINTDFIRRALESLPS